MKPAPRGRRLGRRATGAGCAAGAVALLALAPGIGPELGSAAWATGSDERRRDLDELAAGIESLLADSGAPGAAAALVSRDEGTFWARGFGFADRESARRATADTPFRVGSISKSFVALAVLALVEEGRLALDDRLADLAPEIEFENPWEATDPVRLVHLLEHTSGFDDIHLPEYAHNRPEPLPLAVGLAFHPHSRRSRWPPGTHVSYSNSGPAVAAYVVEKIAGRSFEQHVRETLFEPLGMARATYLLSEEIAGDLATGYRGAGGPPVPYWHLLVRPSGAINASVRELAQLVRLLAGRGEIDGVRLFDPRSIERMERPASSRAARAGLTAGYGLGNFTRAGDGFVFHGHDGGVDGGVASYGYLAGPGVGYALLLNSTDVTAFRGIRDLLVAFLTRGLEPPPPEPAAEVAPAELERLAGWYRIAAVRQELTRFLVRLPGRLRVTSGEGDLRAVPLLGEAQALTPVGGGRFRVGEQPVATLVALGDGDLEVSMGPLRGSWRRGRGPWVVLEPVLALGALLAAASPVFFALVWVPRRLFGRLGGDPQWALRLLPLAAFLALAAAFGLVAASGIESIWRLGEPTPWAIGLSALTWLFALLTAAALAAVWRRRRGPGHRGVWWYALVASAGLAALVAYLARWGIIGLRTWI